VPRLKRVASKRQKEMVVKMYLAGYSPRYISEEKNYFASDVEYVIHKFVQNNMPEISVNQRTLGRKDVPYYKTEEEMLKEPEYTYESLSESEKQMYNEPRTN
jgi:hypothetical protein